MSEYPFKKDADRQLDLLARYAFEPPRRPWWRGLMQYLCLTMRTSSLKMRHLHKICHIFLDF